MNTLLEALQDFWKYEIKYKYEDIIYKYYRIPKYKLILMFKYYKNEDYVCWDCVDSSIELIFSDFQFFFKEHKEELKPFIEDNGKEIEVHHSENWEYVEDGGDGVKYKEFLDIYRYITYTRIVNKNKYDLLLSFLFNNNSYKSWMEDSDRLIGGEKSYTHRDKRLKNYSITYKFNTTENFKDYLDINIHELGTVDNEYRIDIEILHKLQVELQELDNKYGKKIIDIRQYLWT